MCDSKDLLDMCTRDRDDLLSELYTMYPNLEPQKPASVILDVIVDVCGFQVVRRPLPDKQLALCDFGNRIISLNSEMARFVHHKTDVKGLENATLAHELGHLRLHADEFSELAAASTYGASRSPGDGRLYQKEREADLYGAVFLVPKLRLLQERAGKNIYQRYKNGDSLSSSGIWKLVYILARSFMVSPSLMRRCLIDLGWLGVCEDDPRSLRIST